MYKIDELEIWNGWKSSNSSWKTIPHIPTADMARQLALFVVLMHVNKGLIARLCFVNLVYCLCCSTSRFQREREREKKKKRSASSAPAKDAGTREKKVASPWTRDASRRNSNRTHITPERSANTSTFTQKKKKKVEYEVLRKHAAEITLVGRATSTVIRGFFISLSFSFSSIDSLKLYVFDSLFVGALDRRVRYEAAILVAFDADRSRKWSNFLHHRATADMFSI